MFSPRAGWCTTRSVGIRVIVCSRRMLGRRALDSYLDPITTMSVGPCDCLSGEDAGFFSLWASGPLSLLLYRSVLLISKNTTHT